MSKAGIGTKPMMTIGQKRHAPTCCIRGTVPGEKFACINL
jgi:hypothetical protein